MSWSAPRILNRNVGCIIATYGLACPRSAEGRAASTRIAPHHHTILRKPTTFDEAGTNERRKHPREPVTGRVVDRRVYRIALNGRLVITAPLDGVIDQRSHNAFAAGLTRYEEARQRPRVSTAKVVLCVPSRQPDQLGAWREACPADTGITAVGQQTGAPRSNLFRQVAPILGAISTFVVGSDEPVLAPAAIRSAGASEEPLDVAPRFISGFTYLERSKCAHTRDDASTASGRPCLPICLPNRSDLGPVVAGMIPSAAAKYSNGAVVSMKGSRGVANQSVTVVPLWRTNREISSTGSRLREMLPKKTPLHFQSITHWGACRKTPVAAENHHLEAKKVAGGGAAKCGICCRPMGFARTPSHLSSRLFAALSRTNPSRRQTLLPATTTRDLISISEMMT